MQNRIKEAAKNLCSVAKRVLEAHPNLAQRRAIQDAVRGVELAIELDGTEDLRFVGELGISAHPDARLLLRWLRSEDSGRWFVGTDAKLLRDKAQWSTRIADAKRFRTAEEAEKICAGWWTVGEDVVILDPLVSGRQLPLLWTQEAGYISPDGLLWRVSMPLVQKQSFDPNKATLTAEDYGKWYGLQLVLPNGEVLEIGFPSGGEGDTDYCDHAPNPTVVQKYAVRNGYQVDAAFLQCAVERWRIVCGIDPEDET